MAEAGQGIFDYNSERAPLVVAEYGRHIHDLIQHVKTIADDEKRQKTAEFIINMMHSMVPSNKQFHERQDTLWKHFFRMADYEIDVKAPEGVNIAKRAEDAEAPYMDYPETHKRYRHYGQLIQRLTDKVNEMPEGDKKEEAVSLIASYMKLAYSTWNKNHFVNDDVVKTDLKAMSRGKLEADDDTNFGYLASSHKKHPVNTTAAEKGRKKKKRGNNKRRRRRK